MQYLHARLTAARFSDVTFRIITSKVSVNITGVENLRSHAGDIPVMQEPEEVDPTWQPLLEGGSDNILVIDRCGRLAYQVISPWSLLQYPYVKAAILSTYSDDPCGPCNITTIKETHNEGMHDTESALATEINSSEFEVVTEPMDITETTNSWFHNLISVPKESSHMIQISSNTTTNETDGSATLEKYSVQSTVNNETQQRENDTTTDKINLPNIHQNAESSKQVKHLNSSTSSQTQHHFLPEGNGEISSNEVDATLSPLVERKDGTVPITVIIPSNHKHRRVDGTISEHDYVVLQTGNPDYHGHLESTENSQSAPVWEEKLIAGKDNYKKLARSKDHSSFKENVYNETEENQDSVEEKSLDNINYEVKKQYKKKMPVETDNSQDSNENNEDKSVRKKYKGRKNKIKANKDDSEFTEENSMQVNAHRGKKIKFKVRTHPTEDMPETANIQEKVRNNSTEYQQSLSIQVTQENDNSEEKSLDNDKSTEWRQHSQGKSDSTEEVPESSDVPQTIRNHAKQNFHVSETNKIKHAQKSERYHTTQKAVQILIANISNADSIENFRTANFNVNSSTEADMNSTDSNHEITISRNNTIQEDRKQNNTNILTKKTDIHKKNHHNKKNSHESVVNENSSVEISQNENLKPNGDIKKKDNKKSNLNTAYNTDEHQIRYESEDNLQRIEVAVVANIQEKTENEGEEQQTLHSSEENENDGKYKDIIEHYSKLIKWLEYTL